MCGIAGYIGKSKNPEVSYQLITELFDQVEVRGKDAAGVYATEQGRKGAVIYHKEPGPSSKFIKTDFWEDVGNYDIDMMLCHARGTSPGIGGAYNNNNNHPFVSKDLNYGLIHNGRIHEYDDLKSKYQTLTECDSEILLRMLQSPDNIEFKLEGGEVPARYQNVFNGFCDIWSQIDHGHFAIALGQRHENGDRTLYLCRNKHRPIWVADLRKELGQVFFCSTDLIFTYACSQIDELAKKSIPLIEFPAQHMWAFTISESSNWQVKEDEIFRASFKTSYASAWKYEGDAKPIIIAEPEAALITNLEQTGQVKKDLSPVTKVGTAPKVANLPVQRNIGFHQAAQTAQGRPCNAGYNNGSPQNSHGAGAYNSDCHHDYSKTLNDVTKSVSYIDDDDDDDDDTMVIAYDPSDDPRYEYVESSDVQVSSTDITLACNEMVHLIEQITANAENSISEQSMSKRDHEDLLMVIERISSDLKSTLANLKA